LVWLVILLIISGVFVAGVALYKYHSRRRNKVKIYKLGNGLIATLEKNREYCIIADPALNKACVRLYKDKYREPTGVLIVNLDTGQCRVPTPKLLVAWFLDDGSPYGNTLFHEAKRRYLTYLRDKYTPFKADKADLLALFKVNQFYYDSSNDKINSFERKGKGTFVDTVGRVPGSDLLVISEGTVTYGQFNPVFFHLVNQSGVITKTYPAKEDYSFDGMTPSGLIFTKSVEYMEIDSSQGFVMESDRKKQLITEIKIEGWEKNTNVEVLSPEGSLIVGWSPDLTHIFLTPKREISQFIRAEIFLMRCSFTAKQKKKKEVANATENIKLIHWNRKTKNSKEICSIPIDWKDNKNKEFGLLVTNRLLMVVDSNDQSLLKVFDIKTGQFINLQKPIPEKEYWFRYETTSADGSKFIYGFMPIISRNSAAAPINEESSVSDKTSKMTKKATPEVFLYDAETQTRYDLPFKKDSGVTVMKDGLLLGVIGDSLVLYNPKTAETKTIIENLFTTWKSLIKKRLAEFK